MCNLFLFIPCMPNTNRLRVWPSAKSWQPRNYYKRLLSNSSARRRKKSNWLFCKHSRVTCAPFLALCQSKRYAHFINFYHRNGVGYCPLDDDWDLFECLEHVFQKRRIKSDAPMVKRTNGIYSPTWCLEKKLHADTSDWPQKSPNGSTPKSVIKTVDH